MSFRSNIFAQRKNNVTAPNTFIGGLAGSISDASSLAVKLGISESSISHFSTEGSDILADILVDYNIPDSAFYDDKNITSYMDNGGRVKSIGTNSLRLCTKLSEINFPAVETIYANGLYQTAVQIFEFPELLRIGTNGFAYSTFATRYYLPKVIQLGGAIGTPHLPDSWNFIGTRSAEITVPIAMATAWNGGPEGDLVYAKNMRNCTIIYV